MHSANGRVNAVPRAAPDKVQLQAAVDWYLLLNDEQVDCAQREAWQSWLAASPENAGAWARVEKLQQQLRGVPVDVALPILTKMGVQRRQGLKALLLLTAGASVIGGYRISPYSADFATRTGERRRVILADGSQLDLNTYSRVDVEYTDSERVIHLRQGQVCVTTAADRAPARPLSVSTPHGRIRALGTRFDVRLDEGFTRVMVQRHAVEVRPLDVPHQVLRVEAGQTLTFSADQWGKVRNAMADGDAWTQGHLLVIDWRLADFVRELARYRPGYLSYSAEVADLRITGAFLLDDTDAALANLEVSLPVKVRRFSRYWVRVES